MPETMSNRMSVINKQIYIYMPYVVPDGLSETMSEYVSIIVFIYSYKACQGGDHSKKVIFSLRIVVVLHGIVNVVLANLFQDPEGHWQSVFENQWTSNISCASLSKTRMQVEGLPQGQKSAKRNNFHSMFVLNCGIRGCVKGALIKARSRWPNEFLIRRIFTWNREKSEPTKC